MGVAAAEAEIKKIADLKKSLHLQDFKTGCVDTPAGNEIKGPNGETICLLKSMNGECHKEFGIINCRKTCQHNINTCGKKKEKANVDVEWVEEKDYDDLEDEGFQNSWEEF